MAKIQTIVIGKDYEDAFLSICELYKNGFISNKIISNIVDDSIITSGDGNIQFIYDRSNDSNGIDCEFKMDNDGASWFKAIRDKKEILSSDNEWIDLLSNVAAEYHRTNSYLEFSQIKTELSRSETNKHREIITKFFKLFYPDSQFNISPEVKSEESDVYGVSLSMDISLVGETQKVLGRVFFKKINGRYYPLNVKDAVDVKTQIDYLMETEKSKDSKEEDLKDEGIIDDILIQLENTIESETLDKSIVYANKKDEEIINGMLAKGPQEFVELTCLKINVLGIFHVTMVSQYYELMYENNPAFKVNFDRGNSFSISCLNCVKGGYIVENSSILFEVDGEPFEYYLNNDKDLFGLSYETIDFIRNNSNISKHGISISHRLADKTCHRIACESDVLTYEGNKYCCNCPYPSVVYCDKNGVKRVMSSLEFAADKIQLVPKKDEQGNDTIEQCKYCKRYFTAGSIKNRVCKTCATAHNSTDENKNVYKKYKFILPLYKRLSSNKFAVEDDQMIVFRLKDDLYYFNKLSINDNKYMDSPRKDDK